jgi:hypothetical protein
VYGLAPSGMPDARPSRAILYVLMPFPPPPIWIASLDPRSSAPACLSTRGRGAVGVVYFIAVSLWVGADAPRGCGGARVLLCRLGALALAVLRGVACGVAGAPALVCVWGALLFFFFFFSAAPYYSYYYFLPSFLIRALHPTRKTRRTTPPSPTVLMHSPARSHTIREETDTGDKLKKFRSASGAGVCALWGGWCGLAWYGVRPTLRARRGAWFLLIPGRTSAGRAALMCILNGWRNAFVRPFSKYFPCPYLYPPLSGLGSLPVAAHAAALALEGASRWGGKHSDPHVWRGAEPGAGAGGVCVSSRWLVVFGVFFSSFFRFFFSGRRGVV